MRAEGAPTHGRDEGAAGVLRVAACRRSSIGSSRGSADTARATVIGQEEAAVVDEAYRGRAKRCLARVIGEQVQLVGRGTAAVAQRGVWHLERSTDQTSRERWQ